ncbi:MAG: PQQ-dependent sugar dehydrogenase [Thermomicrobiales bacterium]
MLLSRWFRYLVSLALIVSVFSTLTPTIALAHEGHDHGGPEVLGPGGAPPAGSGPIDIAGFVRAIDGDTMETWINGSQVGIGVLGIDVFEANTVCGAQAAGFFQGMLFAGIHAEEDPGIVFDDRLRRMYYVYTPEGDSIAHAMVQAGFAKPTGEGKDAAELAALATEAEQSGAGCVWDSGAGDILPPEPLESASFAARDLLALPVGFQSQAYVTGLNFPTDFAFLPDGRVLVTEKSGIVRVAVDGSVLSTPFIDIRTQVNDYWDRGLLSIAVDPNFDSNGYVYLLFTYEHDESNYSGTKTGRLIRVTATGNTASPSSAVTILGSQAGDSCDNFPVGTDCIPSDGPSHSTGGMRFASDGTLYLTLGEAANFNASTPQALRAQNLDSLGGKLVRIDTSGQGLPDNPYWTGNPNDIRSKIWASGFRNAYRFSLRPSDDTPYVGDVGWVSWEEVNVAEAGANLGWPCYEGTFQQGAYSSESVCQDLYNAGTATPPIITWDHTTGGSAVTGGVFYTGTTYPAEYQGAYFYGDYARNFIRYAQVSAGNTIISGPTTFDDAAGGPVDFEIGPDGDLYYLSITTGQILHVVYGGGSGTSESGYVSDLEWASSSNGWGPAERDQSNGEDIPDDGGPLTLNGTTYTKGVGVHSPSEIVINLDGACSQFTSVVGVDDEVGQNGSVVFDVYSGSTLLATSGVLTGADDPAPLNADLTDVTQLRLVVSDAGDNVYWITPIGPMPGSNAIRTQRHRPSSRRTWQTAQPPFRPRPRSPPHSRKPSMN